MKKQLHSGHIGILLIALIIAFFTVKPLLAQSDDCEKIRVGIYFVEKTDRVFDHLNEKYGPKSKEAWIDEIDTKLPETLKTNSPAIDFFSQRKNTGKDPSRFDCPVRRWY